MRFIRNIVGMMLMAVVMSTDNGSLRAQSAGLAPDDEGIHAWSIGAGGGWIHYEGDEATSDGGSVFLRLGYDYSPRWSFRGDLIYLPYLGSNSVYDYHTGEPVPRPGLNSSSTWAAGVTADMLFHLNAGNASRWDPYLVGGAGLVAYADARQGRSRVDIPIRAGLGLAYHVTAELALNIDLMGQMTIDDTELNFIPSAGVAWKWGARRPAQTAMAARGPAQTGMAAIPGAVAGTAAESIPPPRAETVLQVFEVDMNIDEGAWRPEYLPELDAVAKAISEHPGCEVRIEGHVDRQPNSSEKEALMLTEKRAKDVQDYFVKKHGVARKRITAVGYGFSRPRTPGAGPGAPENRRMEIFILEPQTAR